MPASSTKATSHIISNLHLGADADGVDLKVFGDTTGNYWMYDASLNRLLTSGTGSTLYIGAHHSTTAGSGTALAEAGPSAAVRFYADDGGVAIGTAAGSVPDVKNLLVRTLITVDNSAFDMRLHSIMGQLKGVNAEWGDEQVSAVHGYLELTRSAGTITLQSYGVTSGLMATVETAGNFGVAVTHNLAGVAAISKLGYTGTFTDNTNTSGLYVGIYDSTNWSDSPTLDKWNHGVYIQASAVDKGIQIGELSSSTQVGLTLVAATGTSGLDVFTDDGNVALTGGTPFKGIRSRTMFFKDMITGTTVMGVLGQLKYASGVDVGPARVASVEGYSELMTTNIVKSGGTLDCVRPEMEGTAGTFTIESDGVATGFHANMTGAATFTQDGGGILAGLKVGSTASSGVWGYGIYIATDSCEDGIYVGATTQAHEMVVSALPANARGARYAFTCATPAMSDGYGAHEIDLTITGAATGLIAASSTWVNATGTSTLPASSYTWVHSDGVWLDNSATTTNNAIIWARVQFIFGTNTGYATLHLFDLNFDVDQNMTSLINCNNIAMAGFTAGAHASAVTCSIPFIGTGGSVKYIRVYDSAA